MGKASEMVGTILGIWLLILAVVAVTAVTGMVVYWLWTVVT